MSKLHTDSCREPSKTDKVNLTQVAYLAIKNDIMFNKIKAGEYLSGCQLAKKMNMSRTPVREAISMLESEGFVETHNGLGTFVKEITEKDILELIEVRRALECSALESGTFKLDRVELENLIKKWQVYKAEFTAGGTIDVEEVMALDYETHDFLVACSHNSYLIDLIENISVRFRRVQFLSVSALNDVPYTIEQHLFLLRKIKEGDIAEAIQLLKSHIQEMDMYIFYRADQKNVRRRKSADGSRAEITSDSNVKLAGI